MFDYFYQQQHEQYLFIQLPSILIKDDCFKDLSDGAKILYSLLLNRTSLSMKNGWTDEQGRVYIIYTIEEIMQDLNCWEKKATKSIKELKEIGLIKSIRQGLGKPNLIYVMNFATSLKYQSIDKKESINLENTQTCQKHNSAIVKKTIQEPVKSTIQDLSKAQSIYNDFKNIYSIDIYSSQESTSDSPLELKIKNGLDTDEVTNDVLTQQSAKMKKGLPNVSADQSNRLKIPLKNTQFKDDYSTYKEIIQENIEYSHFLQNHNINIDMIDELVNCMLDVICTEGNTVKINGEEKNRNMVKSVYLQLNSTDIEHILDRYKDQYHKITRHHNYLKTMLYTVKQEGSHFYTNLVNKNMTNEIHIDN